MHRADRPFFGLLDAVLIDEPAEFDFAGSIPRVDAQAVWTWVLRDLAADLIDPAVDENAPATRAALVALIPDILTRAQAALATAAASRESERRLSIALGGEGPRRQLAKLLNALKCRNLIDKAQAFGRATNGMTDDAALAAALQAMPLADAAVAALLMQAAIGQVANPSRLMIAVVRITGAGTEAAITRAGFEPLVEALLAHAQNQIPALLQVGPFADIDLICRAVDRFHRLARAVNGYVELSRNGRWAMILGTLTRSVSERLEPRLREAVPNINMAMRRPAGVDRLDPDQLLQALNGAYLLAAVREARDSLGVNAVFDQAWAQLEQALEIHIERHFDSYRRNPADRVTGQRVEALIKMAELRFSPDYADVLRRAREAAEKR
jgi:hypothetical protein